MTRFPLRRLLAATLLATGLVAVGSTSAVAAPPPATASFTGPIAVPASGTSGIANPYGSSVAISGLPAGATVGDVAVTLTGLSHTFYADLEMLLVSPAGTGFEFFGRVGTGGTGTTARTFTVRDGFPALSNDLAPVTGGTYGPGQTPGYLNAFPAPAPATSAATTFAGAFAGTPANGTWRLYIQDSAGADSGSLAAWTLSVTAATTPQTVTFPAFPPQVRVGDTVPLAATGGGSGNPVTYSVAAATTNDACRVTQGGTAVVFRASGFCAVSADQAGSDTFDPAPTVTRSTNVVAALPPTASLALSPQDASIAAGDSIGYTVLALDGNGVVVPDRVATVSFAPTDGGDSTLCPVVGTTYACAPTAAGAYTVTASAPGGAGPVTTSTSLTVLSDDVAALAISPEDASTTAGEPVGFAVSGTDAFGNPTGDELASSVVTASPLSGGDDVVCAGGVCDLDVAGVYSISATQPGTVGDATTLTVLPGPTASIALAPLATTIEAGDAQQYVVTAADALGNARPDVTYDVDVTASGPQEVACPNARCAPTGAGEYVVQATDGTHVASTTLRVLTGDLAKIELTPDVASTLAGQPVGYVAQGFDALGNALGAVTGQASVAYAPFGPGPSGNCPDAVCTIDRAGAYVVTATVGAVTGRAVLTVEVLGTVLDVDPVEGLVYGDAVPVRATVVAPSRAVPVRPAGADRVVVGDGAPGVVQFALDGDAVGEPSVVDPAGLATLPDLQGVHAGLHRLSARYTPSDPAYSPTSGEQAFVVAQAPTTVDLTVTAASLIAAVASRPGLLPQGDVVFAIDGVEQEPVALTDGVAVLTGSTVGKPDSVVTATYLGSADYLSSADSTARLDPSVTTSVDRDPVEGWYRGPVTVTFSCTPGSAAVLDCPDPVVIDTEGAGQTVTRTVTAADGGIAVVTSEPVDVDLTAPVASVGRVVDGRAYNGQAPKPTCGASDALSGVASCRLRTTGRSPGRLTTTVVATDVAGNRTVRVVRYQVRETWVSVPKVGGAWAAPRGRSATVHVVGGSRPTFYNPMTGRSVRATFGRMYGDQRHWVAPLFVPTTAKAGKTYTVRVARREGPLTIPVRAVR